MGFTVVHQGGTRDRDYEAYVRLLSRQLLKRGVSLDQLPRVREEGHDGLWLYVWDNQAEASAFAEELKTQTGDGRWSVRSVKTAPSVGPLRPLEISVGRQRDGWAFALEPLSRKAVQAKFSNSCRHGQVFVSSEQADFEEAPCELKRLAFYVLLILTGLAPDDLRTFEDFRVVDPVDGKEIVPSISIHEISGE